jgi:hypothetical protein
MWNINKELLILHFTQILAAQAEYKYLAHQVSTKATILSTIKTLSIHSAS